MNPLVLPARLLAGLFGVLLAAAPAFSQGGPGTLKFSISNPGARTLGMAGAFAALADDPTAAFADPVTTASLSLIYAF